MKHWSQTPIDESFNIILGQIISVAATPDVLMLGGGLSSMPLLLVILL
jgi:hypothetical protein